MNSIGIKTGYKTKGHPAGKKWPKYLIPYFLPARILTPTKTIIAKLIVIIKWAVNVELYGIIPNKLINSKNKNNTKIKGKNFTDSLLDPPIESWIVFNIKL